MRAREREGRRERGNRNSLGEKKGRMKADTIVAWLSFDLLQLFLNSDWNRSIYVQWIICKDGHSKFLPSLHTYAPFFQQKVKSAFLCPWIWASPMTCFDQYAGSGIGWPLERLKRLCLKILCGFHFFTLSEASYYVKNLPG